MFMKSLTILALVFAVTIGIAIGYVGGRRISGPDKSQAVQKSIPTVNRKPQTVSSPLTDEKGPFNLKVWIMQLRQMTMSPDDQRKGQSIDRFVMDLPASEVSKAVVDLEGYYGNNRYLEMAQRQLLARWSELDPKAVIAFGAGLKSRQHRQDAFLAGIIEWTRQDPDAAWNWIQRVQNAADKRQYVKSYLTNLASVDPDRAMEKIDMVPIRERQYIWNAVLLSMAIKDPSRAADLALQRPSFAMGRFDMDRSALPKVLERWVQNDPDAVVNWVKANSGTMLKQPILLRLITGMAYQAPEAVLELLDLMPRGSERNEALQQSLANLGSRDPEILKRWGDAAVSPGDKHIAQNAYISAITRQDPSKTWSLMSSLTVTDWNSEQFQQVFSELGVSDPQKAIQTAMSLTNSSSRRQAILGALNGWAQQDPQAAAAYAMNLPRGDIKNSAIQAAVENMKEQNPQAALDLIKQLPDSSLRTDSIRSLMSTIVYQSPEQATKLLSLMPQGERQQQMLQQIARSWGQQDLSAALAWAKQLSESSDRNTAIAGLGATWAASDPEAALKFAGTLPTGNARRDMFSQVANTLGEKDPEEAIQIVAKLSGDASKKDMLQILFGRMAWQDPEKALKLATTLPEGREEVYTQVANAWASKDPTAAMAWAANLPAGKNRAEILANTLGQWASQSPEEAATYVSKLNGEEQERGVQSVISNMARNDPEYAAQWIGQFPEGKIKEQALNILISQWCHADPTAAANLITAIPAGAIRERTIQNFIDSINYENPKLAWKWAQAMGNQDMQNTSMENVARNWLRSYKTEVRAEARTVIQASSLPQAAKDRLLKVE
jgi:hypothetical protein